MRLEVAAGAADPPRRPARAPAAHRRRTGLHAARAARPARAGPAVRDRSARPEGQALEGDHATAVHEEEPRRAARPDPPPRCARPPPLRLVRRERRRIREGGTRSEGRRRSRRPSTGPTTPSPTLSSLVADRREGQAGRLPRRAEGAIRRTAQHRVVARARASGRRRRLRRPRPEDPREARAARPARAERVCAATSTSAPATTTRRTHRPTRTSGCSPRTRTSPPTSPTSSTPSPGSRARPCSASCSSGRGSCATGSCRRSSGSSTAARAGEPARIRAEGQLARRRGDHRGAVRGLECGRDRRHRDARHLLPAAGRARASATDHRAQRARPLPRAQPHPLVPDRRRASRSGSAAPT